MCSLGVVISEILGQQRAYAGEEHRFTDGFQVGPLHWVSMDLRELPQAIFHICYRSSEKMYISGVCMLNDNLLSCMLASLKRDSWVGYEA